MTYARFAFALSLLTLTHPAAAHHAMGGATPDSFMQGLLSGLGHVIIGVDHFLFILAAGIACFYFGQRIATIAVFMLAAVVGTLAHLRMPDLPYADAWVAASLIALGALLIARSDLLKSRLASVLFACSGLVHGYAYGEAIVGAETTPLVAYLAGFTLMQFAIAAAGYVMARYVTAKKPAFALLATAGSVLAAAGAGFLLNAVVL